MKARRNLTLRIQRFKEGLQVMRKAWAYASALPPEGPTFHIDPSLWKRFFLYSFLRLLDSKLLQPSQWLHRPNPKSVFELNRRLMKDFEDGGDRLSYRGMGISLDLPKHLSNAAEVIVNDLREIYVENRYGAYFPMGRLVEEGDLVVDCGASVGAFSLFAARLASQGKVFAFEPEPLTFSLLCHNIEKNGLSSRVRCFPLGLAAQEGSFVMRRNDRCFTMHHLRRPEEPLKDLNPPLDDSEIIVPCTTIDRIFQQMGDGKCGAIKMDIEGAEGKALRGAVQTIRRDRPKLTVAAYHHLTDPFTLPLLVRAIFPHYQVWVS